MAQPAFLMEKKNNFDLCQSGSEFRFHIAGWEQPVHYILSFLKIAGPNFGLKALL